MRFRRRFRRTRRIGRGRRGRRYGRRRRGLRSVIGIRM